MCRNGWQWDTKNYDLAVILHISARMMGSKCKSDQTCLCFPSLLGQSKTFTWLSGSCAVRLTSLFQHLPPSSLHSSYLGLLFTMLPPTTRLCMFCQTRMFFLPLFTWLTLMLQDLHSVNSFSAFPDLLIYQTLIMLSEPQASLLKLPLWQLQSHTYWVIVWLTLFLPSDYSLMKAGCQYRVPGDRHPVSTYWINEPGSAQLNLRWFRGSFRDL